MTVIEQQILETWRLHNRITLFMLENIPAEAMTATLSKRGGRDIARQLAHMYNVRVYRLKPFSKKSGAPLAEFGKSESPSKEKLAEALQLSGTVMEQYLAHCIENGGVVSNFKQGVVPMLGYYITHEAHHRGSILLTMKQCGFRLPGELKWGIWEWKKR
ncbi:MAG: DinB family protein [Saprospiraceae bacterium]